MGMLENARATIAAGLIGTTLASGIDRSSAQKELQSGNPQTVSLKEQTTPGLQKITDDLLVTSLEINKAVFSLNPKLYNDPKVKELMEQFKEQKPDYDGSRHTKSHLRATEALLMTSIELNRLLMSKDRELFDAPQIKKLMDTLSEQKNDYDRRKQG